MSQFKRLNLCSFIIVVLGLSGAAFADNKTGVTDSLREGEFRFDLSFLQTSASPSGIISIGAASSTVSGQITQDSLATAFYYGVTDKINIKISSGFSQNTNQEIDYTFSPNSYAITTTQWEGMTTPEIGIQYALGDRLQSGVGAIVYGAFSPSTPSYAPISEIQTNGIVTTKQLRETQIKSKLASAIPSD